MRKRFKMSKRNSDKTYRKGMRMKGKNRPSTKALLHTRGGIRL